MKSRQYGTFSVALLLAVLGAACGRKAPPPLCKLPEDLAVVAGSNGAGAGFRVDPRASSNDPFLSTSSSALDRYLGVLNLQGLSGKGILEGALTESVNAKTCSESFGAFSENQQFLFGTGEEQHAEVMGYASADRWRRNLESWGVLAPVTRVRVIAHCMNEDNAFYYRFGLPGSMQHRVCLGDSVATPGRSYAEDAEVVVHEVQHAATMESYSPSVLLNRFWYDEAGALNEGISDLAALLDAYSELSSSFDGDVFSRWALQSFLQGFNAQRGSHRCSQLDASYPACTGYALGAAGFSADQNRVSLSYPDGLGWSYAKNVSGPGFLRNAFLEEGQPEEIHGNGVILAGAFMDVFHALRTIEPVESAKQKIMAGALAAIPRLPKPNASETSPVTFRGFATEFLTQAQAQGWSSQELSLATARLGERGLVGGAPFDDSKLKLGGGVILRDNPRTLIPWLSQLGIGNPNTYITQGVDTGLNHRWDRGETVAVWFDLENQSPETAGWVRLDVRILTPGVKFVSALTDGYLADDRAQVIYAKINGTSIVTALQSSNPSFHVPTGNRLSSTAPSYDQTAKTALWLNADASGSAPGTVRFEVQVRTSRSTSLAPPIVIETGLF